MQSCRRGSQYEANKTARRHKQPAITQFRIFAPRLKLLSRAYSEFARVQTAPLPLSLPWRSWLGSMVLLTDRGPSGYLPDVWASLKASAAANPDVPTVLLLVALDVDALSACAILMVRGLGPRAVPAAAYTRPPHTILPPARHRIRPGVLSDPCSCAPCSGCWKLSRSRTR